MKRWLLALALLLNHGLIADRAKAQDAPKQYNLTLDGPDLQILSAGLGKLPYEAVQPLMMKLQAQVVKQSQPVDANGNKAEPQK